LVTVSKGSYFYRFHPGDFIAGTYTLATKNAVITVKLEEGIAGINRQ
jgi:hypothetical protein